MQLAKLVTRRHTRQNSAPLFSKHTSNSLAKFSPLPNSHEVRQTAAAFGAPAIEPCNESEGP